MYLVPQESYNHGVTKSNPCSWVHDNAESGLCFWEGDGLVFKCFHSNFSLWIFWWSYLQFPYRYGHFLKIRPHLFSHDDIIWERSAYFGRGKSGNFLFVERDYCNRDLYEIIDYFSQRKCWKKPLLIDHIELLALFYYSVHSCNI